MRNKITILRNGWLIQGTNGNPNFRKEPLMIQISNIKRLLKSTSQGYKIYFDEYVWEYQTEVFLEADHKRILNLLMPEQEEEKLGRFE